MNTYYGKSRSPEPKFTGIRGFFYHKKETVPSRSFLWALRQKATAVGSS